MRSVLAGPVRQYGDPEVLGYEEVSDPKLGDDEVLIHVAATSINPFDLKLRSGAMKEWLPLEFPAILGVDVSGTIEQCGRSVEKFGYGDKVFAHAEKTYASHCVVKADTLAKIPDGLDVLGAAALPTVTTTGAQLAALALKRGQGETVLVTGAVGNVGRSALFAARESGGLSSPAS